MRADVRNIFRDKMLWFVFMYPIIILAALRWLIDTYFVNSPALGGYTLMFVGLAVMMMPMLGGFVLGFLLLEEKDEHILPAIRVTSVGVPRLIRLRIGWITIYMFVILLLVPVVLDYVTLNWWEILVIALLGATEAGIIGGAVFWKAGNKVEAMAIFKIGGFLLLLPMAAQFVEGPWDLFFGAIYTYWPVQVYLQAALGEPWGWYAAGGVVVHALYIYFLIRIVPTALFEGKGVRSH
jgi:hypothetical protein